MNDNHKRMIMEVQQINTTEKESHYSKQEKRDIIKENDVKKVLIDSFESPLENYW